MFEVTKEEYEIVKAWREVRPYGTLEVKKEKDKAVAFVRNVDKRDIPFATS